ncbi:hypothetical protein [Streptomyces sp. NPDC051286]|uniref:hypothetical protein n=1 Tax=Streptomyces sp. NPDC051286 TaxID=3365647 RepID=UPI0037B84808
MGAVDVDPELKGWILEFVWEKRWVNHRRITREFFPDDPGAAQRYLDQLKAEGAIRDVTNGGGQVAWRPATEATAGPIIPVKWAQYADGKTHTLTEDEIREKYGISVPQFRQRLSYTTDKNPWTASSRVENGTIQFRIEPDEFDSRSPSVRNRNRNRERYVSHAHCDHPITRTDRLACEKDRKTLNRYQLSRERRFPDEVANGRR